MKKNPLKQSEFIKSEFSNYVRSTFVLKNGKYNNDFIRELDNSVLTKGPYLKLELPFVKSFSLNQLIERGIICRSFKNVSNVDFDQNLYLHQYQSFLELIVKVTL